MPADHAESRQALLEALAAHRLLWASLRCTCGHAYGSTWTMPEVEAHQAEKLAEVFAPVDREAERAAAQARADAVVARESSPTGWSTLMAGELDLRHIGLVLRQPPGGRVVDGGLLIGLDSQPSADGGRIVLMDLLPDDQDARQVTVRATDVIEVYR